MNPEKLKLDKNHIIIEIENINVPIFLKKEESLLKDSLIIYDKVGSW